MDFIEHLRHMAEFGPVQEIAGVANTLRHAADEIDRLRARIAELEAREKFRIENDPIVPCGDNSCMLLLDADKVGVRTNGRCRCFSAISSRAYSRTLERAVARKLGEKSRRAVIAEAALNRKDRCLSFLRSVIQSGEKWSEQCEEEYRAATTSPSSVTAGGGLRDSRPQTDATD